NDRRHAAEMLAQHDSGCGEDSGREIIQALLRSHLHAEGLVSKEPRLQHLDSLCGNEPGIRGYLLLVAYHKNLASTKDGGSAQRSDWLASSTTTRSRPTISAGIDSAPRPWLMIQQGTAPAASSIASRASRRYRVAFEPVPFPMRRIAFA